MPRRRPVASRSQDPKFLWMHREVQCYAQSWIDYAKDCETKASTPKAVAPNNPSQSWVSFAKDCETKTSVADNPFQLNVAPRAPHQPAASVKSPPPSTAPSTPVRSPESKQDQPFSTMVGQQANQGVPRRPGEPSPQSTLPNRPTPETEGTENMAADFEPLDLPVLPTPNLDVNEALASVAFKRFNIDTVCAALQSNCSMKSLTEYLGTYKPEGVKEKINLKVVGRASPIFYAIEYAIKNNSLQPIELMLEYGADPDACVTTKNQPCNITVLAFAIITASRKLKDSLEIIKLLLSRGAKPSLTPVALNQNAAPVAYWSNICHEAVNVSHAYFLQRSQKFDAFPGGLKKQLAIVYGLLDLLTIDHYLVGQEYALKLVKDSVFSHIATNSQYPLVMAFAGPSGHGKTEMASQMGKLLSLEITIVDCTHMKHDTDLFGSRNGYKRSEEGTQLNNFLAKHNGESAVVFLDEFDKTPQEIRHSLLLICDSGAYQDRRNNKEVDCSKILWVLATNLGDWQIKSFYEHKLEHDSNTDVSIEPLQQELIDMFKDYFGPPFTGRIDVVVPFLPFTEIEQCVMAHSLLVKLVDEFRLPIDCRPAVKRYIGHSYLDIGDGIELSQHIAKTCYNPELGVRSLKRGIEELKRKFVMAYCEEHPMEVTEDVNVQPVRNFRAQVRRKMDGKSDIIVMYQSMDTAIPGGNGVAVEVTKGAAAQEYDSDDLSSVDNDDDRFLREISPIQYY